MARSIGRPMAVLLLSDEERSYLERQVRRRRVARSISDRCRMILRCAHGLTNKAVAAELGVHEHTVGKWRRRFLKARIEGLSDEPRPGRPRTLTDEQVAEVIERTLETTPADATHWSIRSMARESGLSHTTIRRIWAAFSVQPHRSETFKLSGDPLFVDKVRDIIGLYLSPPDRALVLCVDEKSQIQALDRSQPVLPMLPGMPERCTHDYKRHGTTSLFAALDVATGRVIGKCYRRHRAREFLDFLKEIDRCVPEGLDVHIVMDNYATHKTAAVKAWLARRAHWHIRRHCRDRCPHIRFGSRACLGGKVRSLGPEVAGNPGLVGACESVGDMRCRGGVLPWAPAAVSVTNVACDCSFSRSRGTIRRRGGIRHCTHRRWCRVCHPCDACRPRVRRGLPRHTACRSKYPGALRLESDALVAVHLPLRRSGLKTCMVSLRSWAGLVRVNRLEPPCDVP